MLTLVLSANISDYLLDKKRDNTKCHRQITPNFLIISDKQFSNHTFSPTRFLLRCATANRTQITMVTTVMSSGEISPQKWLQQSRHFCEHVNLKRKIVAEDSEEARSKEGLELLYCSEPIIGYGLYMNMRLNNKRERPHETLDVIAVCSAR